LLADENVIRLRGESALKKE